MPRKLITDAESEPFSPLVDVVLNGMAAVFVVLIIYIALQPPTPVPPPPEFLPIKPTPAIQGVPYFFTLPVVGGAGTRHFSLISGELPVGLELDETTGLVFGVPLDSSDTVAFYTSVIIVQDQRPGDTAQVDWSVESGAIPSALARTRIKLAKEDVTLPIARVGVEYRAMIAASGGVPPYHFRSSELPDGLRIDGNCIRGLPHSSWKDSVTITVLHTDGSFSWRGRKFEWSGGQDQWTYPFVVLPPPELSLILPWAREGERYQGVMHVVNRLPSDKLTWTSDVPGLRLSDFGLIDGVPTQAGTYRLEGVLTAESGPGVKSSGYIRVLPQRPSHLVGGVSLCVDSGHTFDFAIPYRGVEEPAVITAQRSLPQGVSILNDRLMGKTGQVGDHSLSLHLVDARDSIAEGMLVLRVLPPRRPLSIGMPRVWTVLPHEDVSLPLCAEGGSGAAVWSTVTSLPNGLALEGRAINGKLTGEGSHVIEFGARDLITGERVTHRLTLRSVQADTTMPRCLTTTLPLAIRDQPYQIEFASSGGIGHHRWDFRGSLIAGMKYTADGISGTPSDTGSITITAKVRDEVGHASPEAAIRFTVADPCFPIREQLSDTVGRLSEKIKSLQKQSEVLGELPSSQPWLMAKVEVQVRRIMLFIFGLAVLLVNGAILWFVMKRLHVDRVRP